MFLKLFLPLAIGGLLSAGSGFDLQTRQADDAASVRDTTAAATLSPAGLKALIDRGAPVYIYDANGRDGYVEGHVPGARWIEYDAVNAANLPELKDAMLVFYCYNPLCSASHIAAEQARALGYRNVWRMPEGIVGWRSARLPVVAGPMPG